MKTVCPPARMIHSYKSILSAHVPLADVPVVILTAERNREHTVHTDVGCASRLLCQHAFMNTSMLLLYYYELILTGR